MASVAQNGNSQGTSSTQVALDAWLQDAADPDPLSELGLRRWFPEAPPRVVEVRKDSVAERAGVLAGDRLLSLDGQALHSPDQVVTLARSLAGRSTRLEFQRGELTLSAELALPSDPQVVARVGYLGAVIGGEPVPPEMLRQVRFGPLEALAEGLRRTWSMSLLTLDSLRKMLFGELSVKNLSGPITIAKVAGASAQSGIGDFLNFLAILSISLAVLNLLPIPVLDGGHLLFYLIEWVRGRPLSERVQTWGVQIGISLVIGVMILAIANDLGRL